MIGLGMRESGGKFCIGLDTSKKSGPDREERRSWIVPDQL
jgi:hypothetical protein